ncbi:MAG: gamma-glutamyltransferase [Phycisphaerales bacterium]
MIRHPCLSAAILTLLLALLALPAASSFAQAPASPAPAPVPAAFARGVVAADHPAASEAGAQMLRKGGNAVDAAVATSFALSVVRPESCGIGGGGFMIVALTDKHTKAQLAATPEPKSPGAVAQSFALNYRETCPAAIGPEFFAKLPDDASVEGGKSVATPGTVGGLLYALEKWGTLDRATVLAPAIALAREGFTADAYYCTGAASVIKKFTQHPEYQARFKVLWERSFLSGNIKVGDVIKNPEQAAALEAIAKDGAKGFYEGPVAAAIAAAIQRDSGVLTAADLTKYKLAETKPLQFTFSGRQFLAMPPPSSGGVAMGEILGILEAREWSKLAKGDNPLFPLQNLAEAFKHAFADRAEWLGDPAFVQVPVSKLLSREYLAQRAAKIKNTGTMPPSLYGTTEKPRDDSGTSHLCAVDRWGNAVSCTETVNLHFGSWLVVEGYGFILNDEMDDFTTKRGEVNAFGLQQSDKNLPAPGKRPLSSMSPTIVLNDKKQVIAVAGASGGPRIITGTTQVLLNGLVLGQTAQQAVASPRIHHQWLPNVLEMEPDVPGRHIGIDMPTWMRKIHHEVKPSPRGSAVQLILRTPDGKSWDAACDASKGGKPAGD